MSHPANGGGGGSNMGSAPGFPGEDPNGVGRLTGETDQQYIARQTRLKEEAKARMAAKFGSGGLGGVGSSSMGMGSHSAPPSVGVPGGGGAPVAEAPGLPGEDRNGIGRLTGESDEQYIARQTRLRDEAKARMAAKFGSGGMMGGVGSGSKPASSRGIGSQNSFGSQQSFGSQPSSTRAVGSAPSSGGFATPQRAFTPPSVNQSPARKPLGSDDFFASFGT
ncbi:expressed unknown protein [Seminavis robusta]|uniref:Uncharacterized protein n=1 Tax=Seminavis robusta TaxID=568900 RepID=A0A9N8F165_9STRA|nr:expressed unknown protein [Seminavis robusta]|eukprot:Sro3028_g342460.1 n/a (221) ;mRNA; r:8951-9613